MTDPTQLYYDEAVKNVQLRDSFPDTPAGRALEEGYKNLAIDAFQHGDVTLGSSIRYGWAVLELNVLSDEWESKLRHQILLWEIMK